MSGVFSNNSSDFGLPMRELLPPARMMAAASMALPCRVARHIVGRRSLFEPSAELAKRMRQAPFFEHRARHRKCRAGQFRRVARERVIEEPRFERFRRRIVFDGSLEEIA